MSAIFDIAAQRWQDMRSEYERHIDAAYDKALEACAGVLVNNEGRVKHIDGYSLFQGSVIRAYRFASEELKDHWITTPRLSLDDFETQWVQGNIEEAA